jgi:hypothetical protein
MSSRESLEVTALKLLINRFSNVRLESCKSDKVMFHSAGGPLFFKLKWFPGNIIA